jgi:hypothetical protein
VSPISHYHELTPSTEGQLSDAEVERAREIALADSRVTRLLERGKHVAIGGMRLTAEGQTPSHVTYVFYSYPAAVAIEALVDLGTERVDRVDERQYQPPLTAEEMGRAVLLASKDPRIAERVQKQKLHGAGILISPLKPGDAPDRRVVDVRFRPETHRRPLLYAYVDVAEDRVLEAGPIEAKEHGHAK